MNIKTGPVKVLSIDELIIAQAFLQTVGERIKENGQEIPASFAEDLKTVSVELFDRTKADKEKQLKVLKARRLGLSTLEEKRANADAEIARIEKELASTK